MNTNLVRSSNKNVTRQGKNLARLRKETTALLKNNSSALITRDELIAAFLSIAADSMSSQRDKISALKEVGKLQGYYDTSKYNTIDISSMSLEWNEPTNNN